MAYAREAAAGFTGYTPPPPTRALANTFKRLISLQRKTCYEFEEEPFTRRFLMYDTLILDEEKLWKASRIVEEPEPESMRSPQPYRMSESSVADSSDQEKQPARVESQEEAIERQLLEEDEVDDDDDDDEDGGDDYQREKGNDDRRHYMERLRPSKLRQFLSEGVDWVEGQFRAGIHILLETPQSSSSSRSSCSSIPDRPTPVSADPPCSEKGATYLTRHPVPSRPLPPLPTSRPSKQVSVMSTGIQTDPVQLVFLPITAGSPMAPPPVPSFPKPACRVVS